MSGPLPLGEREAELRRRNEDVDRRRSEALRIAGDVVRHQEDKLVNSPSVLRSSSARSSSARSERASLENSPTKSTTSSHGGKSPSSSRSRPHSAHSRFLEEDSTRQSEENASAASPISAGARRTLKIDDSGVAARATPQMGSEATIRYLKARLAVMEEELSEATSTAREREDKIAELETRAKDLDEAKSKFERSAQALKVKLEKTKTELDNKTKSAEAFEQQLKMTLKEQETMERTHKLHDSAAGVKDVRLNRALEEVERYKRLLTDAKAALAEQSEQGRRQADQALAEKKKLVKHKNELINGFKNQMKLIDVLKRQIIHVQAAKLLDLAEKDFTRALELGEQM